VIFFFFFEDGAFSSQCLSAPFLPASAGRRTVPSFSEESYHFSFRLSSQADFRKVFSSSLSPCADGKTGSFLLSEAIAVNFGRRGRSPLGSDRHALLAPTAAPCLPVFPFQTMAADLENVDFSSRSKGLFLATTMPSRLLPSFLRKQMTRLFAKAVSFFPNSRLPLLREPLPGHKRLATFFPRRRKTCPTLPSPSFGPK